MSLFGRKKKKYPLVIAINGVDEIPPNDSNDWNKMTNQFSERKEREIEAKCKAVKRRLSDEIGIPQDQIEFYSALTCYRLEKLFFTISKACRNGAVFTEFNPISSWDKASPEVQRALGHEHKTISLQELVSQTVRVPRIALMGKSKVGKTTTICHLLGVEPSDDPTAPTFVGAVGQSTLAPQMHTLKTKGGEYELRDFPGAAVTSKDDQRYYEYYQSDLPSCDVVVYVLRATDGALAEDQLMIQNIVQWFERVGNNG